MGTRSLTHVKDEGKTIVTIYRQFDGYPTGMGKELFEMLKDSKIVNSIRGEKAPTHFNGMDCLAAWLVGELKGAEIGNVYLYPPDSSDVGEEYVYTIYKHDKNFGSESRIYDKGHLLSEGRLANFDADKCEKAAAEA